MGLGTVRVQGQTPGKPMRSPICKHPSLLQDNLDTGVGRGDRKVATPACAQARPSAPAISAGRSGRTRTPLPATQRPAKVTPAPPVGSQTPAQPGADLPLGRAGARRALARTCSHHRTPTELQDARPCRLQQLTTAGGQEGLVVQELWPSFVPEDAARRKKDPPPKI